MQISSRSRRGYLLLTLLLTFSILALTGTLGILERDTRLKRFSEADLKLNIDTLRRGIDLYRYMYTQSDSRPELIASLAFELENGFIASVTERLINDSQMTYIRGRLATDSLKWRVVRNLILNPSFEDDNGRSVPHTVGTWKGNFTAGDQVPDDWELTATGVQQWVPSAVLTTPATYVVSFWGKIASPTAVIQLKVWPEVGPVPLVALSLNRSEWKRAYSSFYLVTPQNLKIEISQNSANTGDVAYVDGIMLEKWSPPPQVPATAPPAPSAWADGFTIAPDIGSQTLQQSLLQELLPEGASPASLSYWTSW